MTRPTPLTYDDIETAAEEVEYLRHKWLRQNGWEYRCDNPGSLWLWVKDIDGRTVMVDQRLAEHFQRHAEESASDRAIDEALKGDGT